MCEKMIWVANSLRFLMVVEDNRQSDILFHLYDKDTHINVFQIGYWMLDMDLSVISELKSDWCVLF